MGSAKGKYISLSFTNIVQYGWTPFQFQNKYLMPTQ
jgi:hypothetical protein